MDKDKIIDGLRMTMDLCVFDPSTGEEKDPDGLNDLDRATYDACKGALEILEQLPPAQPERIKGRWIIRDNPGTGWYRVTCSECGEDVTSTAPCIGFFPNAKVIWDFCPNCGADMREVTE